jgi:hypothetical protein
MRLSLREAAIIFDWEKFCEITGFSLYARNEGGDDVEVELTLDQMNELGIVPESEQWRINP